MTTLHRSQRAMPLGAILLLALLPATPAAARVSHNDAWARQKFTAAERMREALNGRPSAERTRRQYQEVIDAYRRVYYGAPSSSKADASVVAVAELQVEMGRRFEDNKILQGAVRQYEFLRKQYPGSKYRFDALFTIGEIYKDDLEDPEEAKVTFEEFVHRYPHNRLIPEARDAIAELNNRAQNQERESARREAAKREAEKYQAAADSPTLGKSKAPASDADDSEPANNSHVDAKNELKSAGETTRDTESSGDAPSALAADAGHSKFPRVTMIRHWSTPDYTRVAIDLEQDVKFGSQRIGSPDRIFFDLYNTKLASTLVGKSFDVDDGFLKKIRVAQYKPGLTRVVLEVDDLSAYDAFLLPNPTRLIIDVHGSGTNYATARKKETQSEDATASLPPAAKAAKAQREDQEITSVRPAEHPNSKPKVETAKATVPEPAAVDAAPAAPTKNSKNPVPKPPSADGANIPPNARKVPRKIVEPDDDDDDSSAEVRVAPSKSHGSSSTRMETARVEDLRPDVAPTPKKSKTTASAESSDAPTMDDSVADKPSSRAKSKRKATTSTADIDVREAQPTADGDRSLIRALGLKIGKIVIDPGHGGHDTGTIGPNGLQEKDLVVDVGRRLGKLLETRMGAGVVYTRKDDTFIPLETRTAIANQEQADLFISIHANSSRDANARGVETYYLNFTSNADALEVAARENAVSAKSIHELGDLVKKIALKEKIEESHEFASDVQQALHSGLSAKGSSSIRDRGVKKAPFIVLIGANMPSILAEISFVSNPTDERKLKTPEYRQRIAESLYRGIQKYVSGLSGVKVATKMAKSEGQ